MKVGAHEALSPGEGAVRRCVSGLDIQRSDDDVDCGSGDTLDNVREATDAYVFELLDDAAGKRTERRSPGNETGRRRLRPGYPGL